MLRRLLSIPSTKRISCTCYDVSNDKSKFAFHEKSEYKNSSCPIYSFFTLSLSTNEYLLLNPSPNFCELNRVWKVLALNFYHAILRRKWIVLILTEVRSSSGGKSHEFCAITNRFKWKQEIDKTYNFPSLYFHIFLASRICFSAFCNVLPT